MTRHSNQTLLALFLLLELRKGTASFYHTYFRTLPTLVPGLPTDFTPEELSLLEGSPILKNIAKKKENMLHDFDLLKSNLDIMADVSFEEFRNCRNLVSSRVFGIEIDGVRTGGMVPFAGMLV